MKTNILLDALPKTLEIDGRAYSINYDFRPWILIDMLFCDKRLNAPEKVDAALSLCYGENIPNNLPDAMSKLVWFFVCGEDTENKSTVVGKRICDFSKDDKYIYASFVEKYGIDLTTARLHWWKFRALFAALDGCKYATIMAYRAVDLSTIKDHGMRNDCARLQAFYALDDVLNGENMVSRAGQLFAKTAGR